MARKTHESADISHLDTLDVQQAATLLHLGRDSTRALIETGEIPALSVNPKHTVLLRADVLDYIAREGRRQAETRRDARQTRREFRRQRAPLPDLNSYERELR